MQSAQRYPRDYDGIIAAAPAMYWAELVILTIWAGVFMDVNKQYPYPCELDQITKLGINACDKLDGVLDGLVADTEACRAIFQPVCARQHNLPLHRYWERHAAFLRRRKRRQRGLDWSHHHKG